MRLLSLEIGLWLGSFSQQFPFLLSKVKAVHLFSAIQAFLHSTGLFLLFDLKCLMSPPDRFLFINKQPVQILYIIININSLTRSLRLNHI